MTLSFENDTRIIVKKLAKRNLKADKSRNILIIITIALATCLIMTTTLYFFASQRKSLNDAAGRYQAIINEVDNDTITKLVNDDRVQVGVSHLLGLVSYGDYKLTVRSIDEILMKLAKYPDLEGKLPKSTNEIAITKAFLDRAGLSKSIGDTISLNLGDGEKDYTLCTFVQSYWNQSVQQEIAAYGDWDAQLLEIHADQLDLIQNNENIQSIMVKGDNQTALLPTASGLPYLLIQNCDGAYWGGMREKNLILRGRVPQAPGEIVVGKSFFEQNPSVEIGDRLNLDLGERRIGNTTVDFLSPIQSGEEFVKTEKVQYTIVGEIDMTVSSAYNGYPAYGWLDTAALSEDTGIVAYLQVTQPRKVYEIIPQIAEDIGLQPDEFGDYPFRYHTALLGMYGIYAPGHFLSSDLPKLALALGLVMAASMAVFAYIIRGAFSISAKRKVKELGILKSIGMTPRQIRMMIVYEARWLSVLPILVSVGLGYLFSYGVLAAYSDLTQEVTGSRITASFSPWVAVVSVIFSFLTVRLAASGPARQMGKLRPIEAVKESWSNPSLKKSAKHPILKKCFGFLGNISANSMTANKRLFRTCTVTLSLCMLLMFSFLAVFSVSDINNTKAEQDSHFNVNLTMESGQKIEPALMEELKQLPHIEEQATYTMANCALWVSESELSEEFLSSGGFDTKAAGEYVAKRDGCYRIPCVLIGLEQDAYEDYLMQSGVTYSEQGAALIVNSVVKILTPEVMKPKKIWFHI